MKKKIAPKAAPKKKQSPFVKSNYKRRKNDHYPTIDIRCVEALLDALPNSLLALYALDEGEVVDCCAPNGSGIVKGMEQLGFHATGVGDAYSEITARWIVSNPPYKKGVVDKIIKAQVDRIEAGGPVRGVAMLLRTGFDHAKKYAPLFDSYYYYGQIKMRFRPIWIKPKKGVKKKAPIHNYVWHIWIRKSGPPTPPVVLYWPKAK